MPIEKEWTEASQSQSPLNRSQQGSMVFGCFLWSLQIPLKKYMSMFKHVFKTPSVQIFLLLRKFCLVEVGLLETRLCKVPIKVVRSTCVDVMSRSLGYSRSLSSPMFNHRTSEAQRSIYIHITTVHIYLESTRSYLSKLATCRIFQGYLKSRSTIPGPSGDL